MAAPSPWPSRAIGDPVVRRHHTSEAEVGAPFIPLLDLTGQCPSLRRCIGLRFMPMHRVAAVMAVRRLPRHFFRRVVPFTTGDWGSSQYSLHHVGRANTTCHTVSFDSRALSQHA